MELKQRISGFLFNTGRVLIVPFMELKRRCGTGTGRASSDVLIVPFMELKPEQTTERPHSCNVLIVPFMELKLVKEVDVLHVSGVLIVPFMELKP